MDAFYLIKIGEILLKLGNRKEFENRLRNQLNERLQRAGIPHRVEVFPGRYFVTVPEEKTAETEFILARTPGVNGFARAHKTEKTVEAVLAAAVEIARQRADAGLSLFKAESRRSDKSFSLGSFELSARIGQAVLEEVPGTKVDIHNPQFTINAEIRERAYVFGDPTLGMRGLPVGSGGKGLLLLSGGIDSPVAGYMMARRGMALEAVYFHAYPYTSQEAQDKVVSLATVLSNYAGPMKLWTVPFTDTQVAIKKGSREDLTTLMMRTAMMRVAQLLVPRIGANCIITGESVGQVASQTAENLRLTGSAADYPILRPLCGMDKEDTIALAKKIGSFDISILPYEDCCVLFSPKHPMLKAKFERERETYDKLNLEPLLLEAIEKAERIDVGRSLATESNGKD